MKKLLLPVLGCLMCVQCLAFELHDAVVALSKPQCFRLSVDYEVWLPNSEDPVNYKIELTTHNRPDALSPCDYLISWQLPRNGKVSTGFASYNDGVHFRYRDSRMQEYHFEEDSIPFTMSNGGVQRTAQFVDLLPAFMADRLTEMQLDTTYHNTFNEKTGCLEGVRQFQGYDALEYSYRFNPDTFLPETVDFVYNPASISEQTVTARFKWDIPESADCPELTEEYLSERFAEEFEKFRTSNFRVENLKGRDLPTFSYFDTDGARKNHTRGEADFQQPVLLVYIDPKVGSSEAVATKISEALAGVPQSCEAIYVFADNMVPESFSGSRAANARDAVRKMGITVSPTVLAVSSDGVVSNVFIGDSANLKDDLSQTLFLLR